MKQNCRELLENSPIIAAVKCDEDLKMCLTTDCGIVFLLYGNLMTIPEIVRNVKNSGKMAFVHIDLIEGLHHDPIAVDYIAEKTQADGIISTNAAMIRRAGECSLLTVMRFFLIDSIALENMKRQSARCRPDIIEILPALAPKKMKTILNEAHAPVIASGLIRDREDVLSLLNAGVCAVSSTNHAVWRL